MVQGGGGSLLHGRRGQVEALWWEAGTRAIKYIIDFLLNITILLLACSSLS